MRFPPILAKNLPVVMLSLAGMVWVLWANAPFGLGIAHDSVFYISMAKHLAAGKGVSLYMQELSDVSHPITRYCPLYPLALSGFFLLGAGVWSSVWMLSGILFAADIFLACFLIQRYTSSPAAAAVAGVFLILHWRVLFSWVLTEPLFLLWVNLSLLFLWKYLEDSRKVSFAASAVFCGLALLTRYTGVSYPVSGALCVLLLAKGPFGRRLRAAFLYGFFSFLPLGAWLARNVVQTYRPGASLSQLAFGDLAQPEAHPRSFWSYLVESGDRTLEWLSHNFIFEFPRYGVAVPLVLFAGALFTLWFCRKNAGALEREPAKKFPAMLVIYALCYLLFLVVFHSQAKQSMPLDQRYMAIFYMYPILLFVIWAHREWNYVRQNVRSRGKRALFYLVCLSALALWLGYAAGRAAAWTRETRLRGADKTDGVSWKYIDRRHWFPENKASPR